MLKLMRDYLGKWFLAFIVIMIAIVFVLSGVFTDRLGGGGSATDVATVGDEKITLQELQNVVSREMEMYKSLGDKLPDTFLQQIRQQALGGLVQQKLVLQEAKRLGVSASNKEVMAEIQKLSYFQNKDKKVFDVDVYKKVLEANNLTPGQFENSVRDSLISQRMMQFLEARMRISDDELKREFILTGEQRNLSFVKITKDNAFKKMTVSKEEVEKFLADKNKETLIQTDYAQNNAKYNKEEEVCARHILKRGAEKDTSTQAPADFAKLKPTTANFASLAEKNSEDPGSKKQGGDLGCFPRGAMDKAFESAAFDLSTGGISKPVKSAFGWHYIYVYKKTAAIKISLEKVRHEIAEGLLKKERIQEVRKINKEEAEKIAANWKGKAPAEAKDTGTFNGLEGFIPQIGRAPEIISAAFDPSSALQKGPQVFESQGAFIVAAIKEKKSADMTKFEQEKATQLRNLRGRKMQAFMPAWMETVRSHAKVKMNEKLLQQL